MDSRVKLKLQLQLQLELKLELELKLKLVECHLTARLLCWTVAGLFVVGLVATFCMHINFSCHCGNYVEFVVVAYVVLAWMFIYQMQLLSHLCLTPLPVQYCCFDIRFCCWYTYLLLLLFLFL
ncbi:unnamed protein product [Ceratitis capitata]|uniref:(Mediterranean fruit fly) hypothetical protein n=1 Tax=Ceratitis capitata TaxID=7213 RepID=A0A811U782_CERCA|nr:unnamed protein product [Ceratitis capitata]